jgi:hypothetical protein
MNCYYSVQGDYKCTKPKQAATQAATTRPAATQAAAKFTNVYFAGNHELPEIDDDDNFSNSESDPTMDEYPLNEFTNTNDLDHSEEHPSFDYFTNDDNGLEVPSVEHFSRMTPAQAAANAKAQAAAEALKLAAIKAAAAFKLAAEKAAAEKAAAAKAAAEKAAAAKAAPKPQTSTLFASAKQTMTRKMVR